MLGTIGHRWLVAHSGTSTVPRPKASDSERMNLQQKGPQKPRCLENLSACARDSIALKQQLFLGRRGRRGSPCAPRQVPEQDDLDA